MEGVNWALQVDGYWRRRRWGNAGAEIIGACRFTGDCSGQGLSRCSLA